MPYSAPFLCMSRAPAPPPPTRDNGAERDARPAAPRVVIVEDEAMVAWALETQLEQLGYDVVEMFPNGESALAAIAEIAPDVVMLDINLGRGIDGIETARRMRETMPVTVLFVSAYDDDATRARIAEDVPGAHFLGKPVFPGALAMAIEAATRRPH